MAPQMLSTLTDGLDGLRHFSLWYWSAGLGVFAYVSGDFRLCWISPRALFAYNSDVTVDVAPAVGAGLGFYGLMRIPPKVYGDVCALALAMLGTIAVMTRQEIVLLFMGGLFAEAVMVMLQVGFTNCVKTHLRMAPCITILKKAVFEKKPVVT